MQLDEVPPVIDVHPPHEPLHGWRDFFIHLTTITIGLLIALSLEGLVEWQHHRHLVHNAEASLQNEIASNAKDIQSTLDDLHKQQAALKQDVVVLKFIIKNHKAPEHSQIDVSFHIHTFDDVSWKTAQNTGALSFMTYDNAQEYSDIYSQQSELASSEQQAARDTIVALGPFLNSNNNDPDPTDGQAAAIMAKIEVLQGQLLLVDSFMQGLSEEYKKFLDAHPAR